MGFVADAIRGILSGANTAVNMIGRGNSGFRANQAATNEVRNAVNRSLNNIGGSFFNGYRNTSESSPTWKAPVAHGPNYRASQEAAKRGEAGSNKPVYAAPISDIVDTGSKSTRVKDPEKHEWNDQLPKTNDQIESEVKRNVKNIFQNQIDQAKEQQDQKGNEQALSPVMSPIEQLLDPLMRAGSTQALADDGSNNGFLSSGGNYFIDRNDPEYSSKMYQLALESDNPEDKKRYSDAASDAMNERMGESAAFTVPGSGIGKMGEKASKIPKLLEYGTAASLAAITPEIIANTISNYEPKEINAPQATLGGKYGIYNDEQASKSGEELTSSGAKLEDLNTLYEDQIFDRAMQDAAYRAAMEQAGYGDIMNYGDFGDLGYDTDYMNNRYNMVRDFYGFGDPNLEIKGLKDIYYQNGKINDSMTDEEKIQAIMDRHWSPEWIINRDQWLGDNDYFYANPFNGGTAAASYMDHWTRDGYLSPDMLAEIPGYEGLNDKDLAAMINTGNVINQLENGWKDPNAMAASFGVLNAADDPSEFYWTPNNEEGYQWQTFDGNKSYSPAQVWQALQTRLEYPDNPQAMYYNPLPQYGLSDSDMADYLAASWEKATGKNIDRKPKK